MVGVTALWLDGCSIFPDEVNLPNAGGGGSEAGAGGTPSVGPTSGGTDGQDDPSGGEGGASGSRAGAPTLGGEGGAPNSVGGHGSSDAGEAGAFSEGGGAGASGCAATVIERVTRLSEDTWIDSSKASSTHGDDALNYVNGPTEQRTLLALTVDAVPPGSGLGSAIVTLTLVSNADASSSPRTIQLHALTRSFEEARASWTNWGKGGARQWQSPGGDFGPAIAQVKLSAPKSGDRVTFDVTGAVAEILSDQAGLLAVIAVEVAPFANAPSALAFGSAEGDASAAPQLAIKYCPP